MEDIQGASIEPGSFSFTKAVIEIEPALHPLEQGKAFKVTDRNTVLENHRCVVGAQRQPLLWRKTEDKQIYSSTEVGVNHPVFIAVSESIKFTITKSGCFAGHVKHSPALIARELQKPRRRLQQLFAQRYVFSLNQ